MGGAIKLIINSGTVKLVGLTRVSFDDACKEKDLAICICRAQDEKKSPEIGCRNEEPCYVCWKCGRYFPYSKITIVETLRCPCCGYRIIAKAR
ncbi:MAG: hypothetical protein QXP18_05590, partial [Sulfolobales archaeon]